MRKTHIRYWVLWNESPMGRALIGAGVGDVVEVEAPDGVIRFKVLEISKGEQAK